MKDEKQELDYLLDDDEFARVLDYRYRKAGKPRDPMAEMRIWQRLSQGRNRWVYTLSVLAAVALLLVFVRPTVKDERLPQVKTGVQKLDFSVEWADGSNDPKIKVQTLQPRFVVIYASDDKGERHRVHEPFKLEAQEERIVPLALDPARNWSKVCALTGTNTAELERLEAMLDLVWTQIGERQCVTR